MTEENLMDIKCDIKASGDFNPIINALAKGLKKLFSLPFSKAEANSNRHLALMAAQTEYDRELIYKGKQTYIDGVLAPVEQTIFNSENILQAEKEQELRNYIGNLQIAAEALKDIPDEQISDKEVDEDFFARWRREAKVIGKKELQKIWGRILAEEIARPDSISIRTIETIKSLSLKEAELFKKYLSFVMSNRIIPMSLPYNIHPEGFYIDEVQILESAGLLNKLSDKVVVNFPPVSKIPLGNVYSFPMNGAVLVIVSEREPLPIPGVTLSEPGRQITNICDIDTANEEMFNYIIKVITSVAGTKIAAAWAIKLSSDGKPEDKIWQLT